MGKELETEEVPTGSAIESEAGKQTPSVAEIMESEIETTDKEAVFFYTDSSYKPDYIREEWIPCVGDNMFYRDLLVKVVLSDGRNLVLTYDENKWLTDITIDEQPIYHFEWEYDVYFGKCHLKEMMHNRIYISYEDTWVTTNSWRGETIYQPSFFQIGDSEKMYQYHLTPGTDFLMDGIYFNDEKLVQIDYEYNIPVMTFTEEGNKLSNDEKEALLENCRFMDGAVYIQELQAYYAPDRYLVDARSGSILNSNEDFEEESYIPKEFFAVEEKGDKVWSVSAYPSGEPFLLSGKLPDGRLLELLYGKTPVGERLLVQKNIDGECVATYRWKNNQHGAGTRVIEIITNGVKVNYIYSQRKSYKYLLYDYYGFRYNNRIYQCYYYSRDGMCSTGDEFLSIYCGNEEIVCYDSKKNVLRGKALPVDVDILFGAIGDNFIQGYIYIDELSDFFSARGL